MLRSRVPGCTVVHLWSDQSGWMFDTKCKHLQSRPSCAVCKRLKLDQQNGLFTMSQSKKRVFLLLKKSGFMFSTLNRLHLWFHINKCYNHWKHVEFELIHNSQQFVPKWVFLKDGMTIMTKVWLDVVRIMKSWMIKFLSPFQMSVCVEGKELVLNVDINCRKSSFNDCSLYKNNKCWPSLIRSYCWN